MDPPVPIPNTVVKHIYAESTWLETAWEDRKLPVRAKESFRYEMALFYFVLLPGLRPSAVSVICSTSTEGLVLQDAFAYGVLTNRLTPLGYASKDRKLPVRVKALRMQCFFLSAYMCAIVTVQKYLDGEKYASCRSNGARSRSRQIA